MIRRMFRWMFGKKEGEKVNSDRIYRVLFWLLVIGGGMVALAYWCNWILYYMLTFVGGALTGILLERRRRRRILREAELEEGKGLFGWRRRKKAAKEKAEKQERGPAVIGKKK